MTPKHRSACRAGAGWFLFVCAWLSLSAAPQGSPGTGAEVASPPDGGWPKLITSGTARISFYPPQVESWEGTLLKFRAALSVKVPADRATAAAPAGGDPSPEYREAFGAAWFSARTLTDREHRVVTIQAMRLEKVSFPTLFDDGASYEQTLADSLPNFPHTFSLDRLETALAMSQVRLKTRKTAVRNDPPRIFYCKEPTALVLVDGPPALRPVGETGWLRVVNTRSTLLHDPREKRFFLHLPGTWLAAGEIEGPWEAVTGPTGTLDALLAKVRDELAAASRSLKGADSTSAPAGAETAGGSASPAEAPSPGSPRTETVVTRVRVSTVPAELVQTDGDVRFRAIAGTGLQEVSNSPNALFFDPPGARYYLLLSGRWFAAPALDGPWTFVPGSDLPEDFLRIPENDPKGYVLASIPSTPQSREALIAGSIPQTAVVKRKEARTDVNYDGDPRFVAIDGTSLQYAVNADIPVVRVDAGNFYAVRSGVWFRASAPDGPWEAADSVPPAVYEIPPSSPVHPVTYVNVYNVTPEEIWVGYLPGYLGSYVCPDETVVYGTGWLYAPWVGARWYARPWTWGYAVELTSGSHGGWTWTCAVVEAPGWGPWWWGWDYHGGTGDFWAPWWTGMGGWAVWVPVVPFYRDQYEKWSANVIRNNPQIEQWRRQFEAWRHGGLGPSGVPGARPDNLFAGRDGQVYRRGEKGWEAHDGKGWKPVAPGAGGEGLHNLERENLGRMLGDARMQSLRTAPMPSGFSGFRRR